MILTQEELNLQFPPDPLPDTQYSVSWYPQEERKETVIVFDKLAHKVVYKGTSKDHKEHYPHIRRFYGSTNCDKPKQINPTLYQNL